MTCIRKYSFNVKHAINNKKHIQVHSTSVHICGVVVEYQTPTGRVNKGVATTWLQEKIPTGEGEEMVCPKVPVYVRRSQFRLPNRPQTPVIMIGPGTGLAPFRGFIQVQKKGLLTRLNTDLLSRKELGKSPRVSLLVQQCCTLDVETRTRITSTRRSWRTGRRTGSSPFTLLLAGIRRRRDMSPIV